MKQLIDEFVPVGLAFVPISLIVSIVSATLRIRRDDNTPLRDAAIDATIVFSTLFAAYLVFSPQPQCPDRVELMPGEDLMSALRADPDDVLPWVQILGNGMLLLPLGALIPLRVRCFHTLPRVALAGMCTSAMIELIQGVAIVGRTASTDDVILNTLGVTIGAVLTQHLWQKVDVRVVPAPRFEEAATVPRLPVARSEPIAARRSG